MTAGGLLCYARLATGSNTDLSRNRHSTERRPGNRTGREVRRPNEGANLKGS